MPLLLRGLELPDANIRADVIETLVAAIGSEATEQQSISEHASTLVSTMLKNCIVTEVSSTVSSYLLVREKILRMCVCLACARCSLTILKYPAQHRQI